MDSSVLVPSPAVVGGSPLYLTGEDAIRLTAFNSAAGVSLALRGRFLPVRQDPREQDARVGVFEHALTPTTARVASTRTEVLGEGWLMDWSVSVTAGTPIVGQCFAAVSIVRGKTGNTIALSTIGSGYVTAGNGLAGPGGMIRQSTDGPGAVRAIVGTTPAAGADISETVPTAARWLLRAFRLQLTTSATVATRTPQFFVDDGANRLFIADATGTTPAGQVDQYGAGNGLMGVAAIFAIKWFALPTSMPMLAGFRLRTLTNSIQAGDQWAAPQYLVEEWIEA